MRLPTPEQMVASVAGLLIIASLVWWWLLDVPTATQDIPSWKGDAVLLQRAVTPQFGDFSRDYNVNESDPFVPFIQRGPQIDRIHRMQNTSPRPPKNGHRPEPPPKPIAKPQLVWTQPKFTSASAPVCVGEIACDAGQVVMVHMPGGTAVWRLTVGDKVPPDADTAAQWTLEAVIDNNLARFKDPSGVDQDLPIGGPLPDPPPAAGDAETSPKKPQNGVMNNGGDQQGPGEGQGQGNGNQGQKPRRPRRGLPPGMLVPGPQKGQIQGN
jgi:hypothetical protein